jgi:hypothetical protein
MKNVKLAILLFLTASYGLNAQNIDTSREKDKKEKNDQPLNESKAVESIKGEEPNKAIKFDLIKITAEEELVELETVTIIKTQKKTKSNKKSVQPLAQKFRVRLLIQNNNPHPMWYLMPYNGANRLPANGLFNAEPSLIEAKKMLSMRQYEGLLPQSYLREILFTGLENQHFRAFYLPAGASLSLRNYNIDCWQDSETVEFWAVKELKANNSIVLQDILPYEILSSANVEINCPRDQNCQSTIQVPDDKIKVSEEPIRFIKADKVSKYLIRLNQPQ